MNAGHASLRKMTPRGWIFLLVAAALIYVSFQSGIDFSANWIWTRPEYGHGLVIPFISAFLVWQQREALRSIEFSGSWFGVALILTAGVINLVGQLASLFIVQQYAAAIAIYGLVLSLIGTTAFGRLWVPLLLLVFMIPLPDFIYNGLSAQLQLLSSRIGVGFIRLFGISVYLQGNVIDLGSFKLQVAEACDGLRYLFPLMTLGFIVAYFFKAAMWKRILLFLSSIPITIVMNSFRIGTIGVMVEHWGISMAEGFLHEFQGWVLFMASVGLMLLEAFVLSLAGRDRKPWRAVFGLELPAHVPPGTRFVGRQIPLTFYAAIILLLLSSIFFLTLPTRQQVVPSRAVFTSFPLTVDDWSGRRSALDRIYTDELRLDDYLLADYSREEARPINFYVAWYNSQQAGRSAHSPRSCLPAGGWQIQSLEQVLVPGVAIQGTQLRVNRAMIQLGDSRLLVYYWFQQRGRILTNEYLAKWYLFWDSLTRNRTDGALVRLTIPLDTVGSERIAEAQLVDFASKVARRIDPFVPT